MLLYNKIQIQQFVLYVFPAVIETNWKKKINYSCGLLYWEITVGQTVGINGFRMFMTF